MSVSTKDQANSSKELNLYLEETINLCQRLILAGDITAEDSLWPKYQKAYGRLSFCVRQKNSNIKLSDQQQKKMQNWQELAQQLLKKLQQRRKNLLQEIKQIALTSSYGQMPKKVSNLRTKI